MNRKSKKPEIVRRAVSFYKRERWKQRPKFQDYYIPFTTFVDENGVPNFQVVNQAAIMQALMKGLCGVCGQSLRTDDPESYIALIGAEMGLKEMQETGFIDPPMHPECAYYAAETCPYLKNADAKYAKKPNLRGTGDSPVNVLEQTERDKGRPIKMMILFAKGYTVETKENMFIIHPKLRPEVPHIIDRDAMP